MDKIQLGQLKRGDKFMRIKGHTIFTVTDKSIKTVQCFGPTGSMRLYRDELVQPVDKKISI